MARGANDGERGASAVEFAAVLPLLLLLLFGTIEFSLIMYDRIQISNAARELARYASVFTPPDLTNPTNPRRTSAEIDAYAVQLFDRTDDANTVFDLGDVATTFGNRDFQTTVLSTCPNVCTTADCFAEIGIQFTHDYLLFIPGAKALFPSSNWASITLRARTKMRCE